jgi:hypothetical protein
VDEPDDKYCCARSANRVPSIRLFENTPTPRRASSAGRVKEVLIHCASAQKNTLAINVLRRQLSNKSEEDNCGKSKTCSGSPRRMLLLPPQKLGDVSVCRTCRGIGGWVRVTSRRRCTLVAES